MVTFVVTLLDGKVKKFKDFTDDEGMGCFYNDEEVSLGFDFEQSMITVDDVDYIFKSLSVE